MLAMVRSLTAILIDDRVQGQFQALSISIDKVILFEH